MLDRSRVWGAMARSCGWVAVLLCVRCGQDGADRAASTLEPLVSTSQCPPQAVEGIDVFDGQGSIDWSAVKGSGVVFAWIKATQGTYDTQATFRSNWAGAQSAGVLRGAYHFFDPREDGTLQAQHFLSVVGGLSPGDLPAMVDIECPDGDANCLLEGVSGQAAGAEIGARMRAFLKVVGDQTSKPPVLYTFASYFTSSAVDTSGLDAFPLFLAYPTTQPCVAVPAPWSAARFWQYSWAGSVAGVRSAVDRDRFLGSLADLRALAASARDASDDGAARSAAPTASPSGAGRATAAPSEAPPVVATPSPSPTASARLPAAPPASAAGVGLSPRAASATPVSDSGCGCRVIGARPSRSERSPIDTDEAAKAIGGLPAGQRLASGPVLALALLTVWARRRPRRCEACPNR